MNLLHVLSSEAGLTVVGGNFRVVADVSEVIV